MIKAGYTFLKRREWVVCGLGFREFGKQPLSLPDESLVTAFRQALAA